MKEEEGEECRLSLMQQQRPKSHVNFQSETGDRHVQGSLFKSKMRLENFIIQTRYFYFFYVSDTFEKFYE